MTRVLVTGMSGTGKTALLDELSRRGRPTLDTDHGGWVLPDGTWDEPRMTALLSTRDEIVVSGTVDNQGLFYDLFEHVVLLSAPLEVLLRRVRDRANPYGRTPQQRAEIAAYHASVEPLLRRGATLELDATAAVASLADRVEGLLGQEPGSR